VTILSKSKHIFFIFCLLFLTTSHADLIFNENFKIISLGFIEEEISVNWIENGTYNAQNNLKVRDPLPDTWNLTKIKGADASIDNAGIVSFGEAGGEYLIKITYTEQACEDTMKLIVSPCMELSGSVAFGSYNFSLSSIAVPNGEPDDEGYCPYDINGAGINLEMPHESINIDTQRLDNIHLIFKYRYSDKAFKDVEFSWSGNKVFKASLIDVQLSNLTLNINSSGQLNGSIDLQASLNQDVSVKAVAFLRRGVTGKITLNYSNASNWAGVSWDFEGVDNIKIEIEKNGKILASATGSLDSQGILDASLLALPGGTTYNCQGYELVIPAGGLNLRFKYNIANTEIEIISGNANIKVQGISGINGFVDLSLIFNQENITASIGLDNANAFGMEFSDVLLEANFDMEFNLNDIKGSISAKHSDFESKFENITFEVNNGRLERFGVRSIETSWKNFSVSIADALYVDGQGLKFNISLKVDGLGNLDIENFKISSTGSITLDKIQGDIDKSPVDVHFLAQFAESSFTGEFSGSFPGNVNINGAVVVGVYGGESGFTYAYLQLAVGANIPLGSSGLKVKEISGEFGYNYNASSAKKIRGNYEKGTHTIGLGLKISDNADLMLLGGYIRLILGSATSMELIGDVQVTADTEYFAGNMTIQYTFGETRINGSLSSKLHIPSDGSIIKINNCTLAYEINSNQWKAAGNLNGIFFNNSDINIRGDMNLRSSLRAPISGMTGSLNGNIQAAIDHEISYPDGFNSSSCSLADDTDNWCGFGFKGGYDIDVSGGINIRLKESGVSGSFSVQTSFSGYVKVKWPCYPWGCGDDCVDNYNMSANGRLTATQNESGQLRIKGRLQFSGGGETKDADLDFTI